MPKALIDKKKAAMNITKAIKRETKVSSSEKSMPVVVSLVRCWSRVLTCVCSTFRFRAMAPLPKAKPVNCAKNGEHETSANTSQSYKPQR